MDKQKIAEAIVAAGLAANRETSAKVDPTELPRRVLQAALNADQSPRAELEQRYGQCWSTAELSDEFRLIGFMTPFVLVVRKSTGEKGSLEFRHSPRLYFNWKVTP